MNLVQVKSDIINSIQSCSNKFHSGASQIQQKYHSLSFNAKLLIGTTAAGTLALTSFAAHQYLNAPAINVPSIEDPFALLTSTSIAVNTVPRLNDFHSITPLKDQIDSLHLDANLKLNDGITLPKSTILPVSNGMSLANHSLTSPVPLFLKDISKLPPKTAPKLEDSIALPKSDILTVSNGMSPANHSFTFPASPSIKHTFTIPHNETPILSPNIILSAPAIDSYLNQTDVNETIENISIETDVNASEVENNVIPQTQDAQIEENFTLIGKDGLRNLFEKQAEAGKYETMTKDQLAKMFGTGRDLKAEQGRKLYNEIAKLNLEFGVQALKNPQISDQDVARAACETRHNTKVYIRSRLSECMQQASEHIDWIRHKNITGLSCEKIMNLYKNNATKIVQQAGSPNNDVNFIAEILPEHMFSKMPAFLRDGLASTVIKPLVLSKAIQKGDVKGAGNIITPEAVSDVVPTTIYTGILVTAYKVLSVGVRGFGRFFNCFKAMP